MTNSKAKPLSIVGSRKAKSAVEKTATVIFTVCSVVAIAAVFVITIYMIYSGAPALYNVGVKEILFSTVWEPSSADPKFGIAYIILSRKLQVQVEHFRVKV